MLKIAHRINTVSDLQNVPNQYGIELDIRYENDYLILHHDPFCTGEKFEDLLKVYQHKLLILNVKTEGIEAECLRLLEKYNIKDYFFLDLSLPYLVKWSNKGLNQCAVRLSEYEPLEFVLKFANKVDWVWVDCFTVCALTQENYAAIKEHFKICLVSPELHGHTHLTISDIQQQLTGLEIDAVCTKKPELW